MKKEQYKQIENYMLQTMKTSSHDIEHVYRVLYVALEIANHEKDVDYDVLITACLLHDIGRVKEAEGANLCHAEEGGIMAHEFLIKNGYDVNFANKVKLAILQHRFRKQNKPSFLESKILFDSDKIDVLGCIGICRTLIYQGEKNLPIYDKEKIENNKIIFNLNTDSFVTEFHIKLKNLSSFMFTKYGKIIAKTKQKSLLYFYNHLVSEIELPYKSAEKINKILE